MSLLNMALAIGPTITATGGTTQTFGPDGVPIDRGVQVSDVAETDIRTRDFVSFKSTKGVLQKDGTWSKDKRSVRITSPDLLADGKQDMPFIEIFYTGSPLNAATKMTRLKEMAAQVLFDSDTSNFWSTGNLA